MIVAFITERDELEAELPGSGPDGARLRAVDRLAQAGLQGATDMTDQVIRDVALPTGLVDNKVCAIDDTWSGLRLVIRRENR